MNTLIFLVHFRDRTRMINKIKHAIRGSAPARTNNHHDEGIFSNTINELQVLEGHSDIVRQLLRIGKRR